MDYVMNALKLLGELSGRSSISQNRETRMGEKKVAWWGAVGVPLALLKERWVSKSI